MPKSSENKPNGKEEPKKNKLSETFENMKKNDKIEGLYSYAKSNTKDTLAYIAVILGIIWTFFHPLYGGLLIGLVFGIYFSQELQLIIKKGNLYIEKEGMVKSLILGGTMLAIFISSPGIFVGAAVAVGLRQLFTSEKH